jgi:hypothetical protein
MAKKNVCCWCDKLVLEPDNYKPHTDKILCSHICWYAEKMFCNLYSDEAITMRELWEDAKDD